MSIIDDELDEGCSRLSISSLVTDSQTDEQIADVITYIATLSGDDLKSALPSLCVLAEKCSERFHKELKDIVFSVLIDVDSTRGDRKACVSCLKLLTGEQSIWSDFYVLLDALEEPQFHLIKPVINRYDKIETAVCSEKLEWKWLFVIFNRAFFHTNGWIRAWSIEKALDLPSSLNQNNDTFIVNWLLPALNSIDILWRLWEKDILIDSIDKYSSALAQLLEETRDKRVVLEQLLNILPSLGCPATLFFLSKALSTLPVTYPVLQTSDFHLLRSVILKLQYISQPSLKIATEFNFLCFFVKIIDWNSDAKLEFGCLSSHLLKQEPSMFTRLSEVLRNVWSTNQNQSDLSQIIDYVSKHLRLDMEKFNSFIWLNATVNNQQSLLATMTFLELSNLLIDQIDMSRIDSLLSFLLDIPENEVVDSSLLNSCAEYIVVRVGLLKGDMAGINLLQKLYIPFLTRFLRTSLVFMLEAISPTYCYDQKEMESQDLSTDRRFLLLFVMKAVVDLDIYDDTKKVEYVKKYIGEDLLDMTRYPKSKSELSSIDFGYVSGVVHGYSIAIYRRLLIDKQSPKQCVTEAVALLDSVALYSVKEQLLNIIADNMKEITDSKIQTLVLKAAANVVKEEKKSLNSLPSVAMLFKIALQKTILDNEELHEEVMNLFMNSLSIASLNSSIALVLSEALGNVQEYLDDKWACPLFYLSIFGPILKKESRVLHCLYDGIYQDNIISACLDSNFERLHEVAQRARFQASMVVLNCCKRSPSFTKTFIQTSVRELSVIDESNSRSFGLSLAHRQKTRALALLLFVADIIDDEETSNILFDKCIGLITDPAQQFSIKLLSEWILVRFCHRQPEYQNKLMTMGKKVADTRVGSISSWINILLHVYRINPTEASFDTIIELIIPCSTAQNFAVRCTALAAMKIMYSSTTDESRQKWYILKKILNFDLEPAGNSRRIVDNLCEDFYFSYLDMVKHFSMETAFSIIPSKTGLPQDDTIPNRLIQSLNKSSFPSLVEDDKLIEAPSLVYSALTKNNSCAPSMELEECQEDEATESENNENALQRKLQTKDRPKPPGSSLIVVASLIDKTNNLGGICRTSEIFGVDNLVISDTVLVNDKGFKALSMSSENWQKMEAVKPSDLIPYLRKLRSDGYVVIAAEQTVDSVPMHKFVFPKKCVLLLGEERAGVPTNLLQCVDQTVEIDQLGQTRSLNVHVTAALFIAKYTEQIVLNS